MNTQDFTEKLIKNFLQKFVQIAAKNLNHETNPQNFVQKSVAGTQNLLIITKKEFAKFAEKNLMSEKMQKLLVARLNVHLTAVV